METHSFPRVSGDSPKTLWKLWVLQNFHANKLGKILVCHAANDRKASKRNFIEFVLSFFFFSEVYGKGQINGWPVVDLYIRLSYGFVPSLDSV